MILNPPPRKRKRMPGGVSGGSPSTMRPFGFSRGGPTKRPKFTFDTATRHMLEALTGEHITPVITRANLQRYVWILGEKIDELWDATGGRLSAREQRHVLTIKRVITWLQDISQDFP